MTIENVGPGNVGNSYGQRTVVNPRQMASAGILKPDYNGWAQEGEFGGGGGVSLPDGDLGDIVKSGSSLTLDSAIKATLRDRSTHTGTQLAETISDFAATARTVPMTGLSTASADPVTAADTLLSAVGKLQAQANSGGGASGITSHAVGGVVGALTTGQRVIVGKADIPATLRVGDLLTLQLAFVAKNLGTVAGNILFDVYFTPTSRGDLSYVFAGLSKTFSVAHTHGDILHKYAIRAPGNSLCMTGASGGNSGTMAHGMQTVAGFMGEFPESNIGSQSTAVPLWTEEPLSVVVVASQTTAGAEDFLWVGPVEVSVSSAGTSGRGFGIEPGTPTTHVTLIPSGGSALSLIGPPIAQLAGGVSVGGSGSALALAISAAAKECNWGLTSNPAVPLYAQPGWEFVSNASGASVTVVNDPLKRADGALLTTANFDTIIGTTLTGSGSGQRAMTFTAAPSDAGKIALRDFVSELDPVTAGEPRSERAAWARYGDGVCGPGDTVWIACSLEFASTGSVLDMNASTVVQLWQIHAGAISGTSNSPCLALEAWQGNLYMTRYWATDDTSSAVFQSEKTLIATAPARNTPTNVITKAALHGGSQAANGLTEVWVGATKVATIAGGNSYSIAQALSHRQHSVFYIKGGIYAHGLEVGASAHCHRRHEYFWRNPSAAVDQTSILAMLTAY